ncbi:MAG TPA: DNA-deoxyinosine glycosylase, partial [Desulfopila sp.]|nr:DNA-deoxyinosine glycosylase [Desulfopila sp.]
MLHSFAPVATPATKLLILGSMPGAQSLAEEEYYAHPRNGFWPIMGELFGATPALAYTQRLEILCENNIGLWDVIGSCQRRTSSLDSAIEEKTI